MFNIIVIFFSRGMKRKHKNDMADINNGEQVPALALNTEECWQEISLIFRGHPAKSALSAMRKHGR